MAARLFGDAAGSGHGPGIVGVCAGQLSLARSLTHVVPFTAKSRSVCSRLFMEVKLIPNHPTRFLALSDRHALVALNTILVS